MFYSVLLLSAQQLGTVVNAVHGVCKVLSDNRCIYSLRSYDGADIVVISKPSVSVNEAEYLYKTEFSIFDRDICLTHRGHLGLIIAGSGGEYGVDMSCLDGTRPVGKLEYSGVVSFNGERVNTSKSIILASKAGVLV